MFVLHVYSCISASFIVIFASFRKGVLRLRFVLFIFFVKQKTAYDLPKGLEFRRGLFRSLCVFALNVLVVGLVSQKPGQGTTRFSFVLLFAESGEVGFAACFNAFFEGCPHCAGVAGDGQGRIDQDGVGAHPPGLGSRSAERRGGTEEDYRWGSAQDKNEITGSEGRKQNSNTKAHR